MSSAGGRASGFATERDPRLRLLIPMVVAVAFLMEQLDSTIITTAVPDMAASLGATPVQMDRTPTARDAETVLAGFVAV